MEHIERENFSLLDWCAFPLLLLCSSVSETLSTNSLAPTRRFDTPHGGDEERGTTGATSEDTTRTTTTPLQVEAAATQANGANSDSVSVDTVAEGQLEVNLLDISVSAEDIFSFGLYFNPRKRIE